MPQKYNIIGVCLSKIHDESRYSVISALNRYAVQNGFRLLIFNSCTDLFYADNQSDQGEAAVFKLIPYDLLSAMIVFPQFLFNEKVVDDVVCQCLKRHIPVISIEKEIEGCVSFFPDFSKSFYKLCDHVIRHHHARKLMIMAGTRNNPYSDERIAAFRQALTDNGLAWDESMVGYGDFWEEPAQKTVIRWFEEEKRELPDAIICANDAMALVVSTYLQKNGYRVPDDCIVTGFDGIVNVKYHIPHLTTCSEDFDDLGSSVISTVMKMMNGERPPQRNMFGYKIHYSQSCGCEPVVSENVNEGLQLILSRLWTSNAQKDLICGIQTSMAKAQSLAELPSILINDFVFHTNIFAVNDDIFKPPHYGRNRSSETPFTDQVDILFQRYFWNQKPPCKLPAAQLIPELSALTARSQPIIVCAIHFLEFVMGYCVFQPDIEYDEYEKMHAFMSAVNAAFGTLHGRMQLTSMNRELEKLSRNDYMTGLLNRRGFFQVLEQRLSQTNQEGLSLAFISADLDGLKHINDTYGHSAGDHAIAFVGHSLLAVSENEEICARFGGDEFAAAAIIPTDSVQQYLAAFKKRFREHLAHYNSISKKPYDIEASIGYYTASLSEQLDIEQTMKNADDMMYAEKQRRKKQRL